MTWALIIILIVRRDTADANMDSFYNFFEFIFFIFLFLFFYAGEGAGYE